ncbi:unnamed protein product [Arabis nemorensis]|uniref:Uncharacterized protein n=1 Tax=Arabis nemorensis TaxID=586526 RepID=A0A565AZM0_9BRAS|nr:unnamed protein product [Arabis nemorensis]
MERSRRSKSKDEYLKKQVAFSFSIAFSIASRSITTKQIDSPSITITQIGDDSPSLSQSLANPFQSPADPFQSPSLLPLFVDRDENVYGCFFFFFHEIFFDGPIGGGHVLRLSQFNGLSALRQFNKN